MTSTTRFGARSAIGSRGTRRPGKRSHEIKEQSGIRTSPGQPHHPVRAKGDAQIVLGHISVEQLPQIESKIRFIRSHGLLDQMVPFDELAQPVLVVVQIDHILFGGRSGRRILDDPA